MFITIEGIDGAGKSTQAEKISQWLEKFTGIETYHTFEPGGWDGGKSLRDFILADKNFSGLSELLLFLADRAGHLENFILPHLQNNHNVICERYNDSTIAYQAGGHNLEISQVKKIISACNFRKPDIKIFLDISPEIAITRIRARNNQNDKFEAEGLSLMRRVSQAYRELHADIKIICDNKNELEVFDELKKNLEEKICAQSR